MRLPVVLKDALLIAIFAGVCVGFYKYGHHHGLAYGKYVVLQTTPASEELETACLNLWVSKQNKKYMERRI
jgi:hypothetical protein